MVKSFSHFCDNEASDMISASSDPIFSKNLFFQKIGPWKDGRKELVPALTQNRVKSYYTIIKSVCHKLHQYIDEKTQESPEVDIDEVSAQRISFTDYY